MKCATLAALLTLFCVNSVFAEVLNLDDYLQQIQNNHPLFKKEKLSSEIESLRRESFLGAKDWQLSANSSYVHQDLPATGLGMPEQLDDAAVDVSLKRELWKTGGRASLSYNHGYTDQDNRPISIPLGDETISIETGLGHYYKNALLLSYTQPLLKNLGGVLDRLNYDLAAFDVERSELIALENQEAFLESSAILYLDWVEVVEKQRIIANRVKLAEKQLAQAQRKFDANVVERVDVLRAKNDVLTAKQLLAQLDSIRQGLQAQLATITQNAALYSSNPGFSLYKMQKLPSIDSILELAFSSSRILSSVSEAQEQAKKYSAGAEEQRKHQLNVSLQAGVSQTDESVGQSYEMDDAKVGVFLEYSYPLGNTTAEADVSRALLQERQLTEAYSSEKLALEGALRNIVVQIGKLERVLELNQKHIKTAQDSADEELKLYNQGRGELNFVLQARDGVQNAKFQYAENAALYHKLLINYRSLIDDLL